MSDSSVSSSMTYRSFVCSSESDSEHSVVQIFIRVDGNESFLSDLEHAIEWINIDTSGPYETEGIAFEMPDKLYTSKEVKTIALNSQQHECLPPVHDLDKLFSTPRNFTKESKEKVLENFINPILDDIDQDDFKDDDLLRIGHLAVELLEASLNEGANSVPCVFVNWLVDKKRKPTEKKFHADKKSKPSE